MDRGEYRPISAETAGSDSSVVPFPSREER
jgi:hypothetical protein